MSVADERRRGLAEGKLLPNAQEYEEILDELNTLRRIAARVEPSALTKRVPKPLERHEVDFEVRDKIVALAITGQAPSEIRAELGIPEDVWRALKREDAHFRTICVQARDLGKAKYMKESRRALDRKDYRYPFERINKFVTLFDDGDDSLLDQGSAADLIRLDTRPPEVILAEKGERT